MFKPINLLSKISKFKYKSPYPTQSISPPSRRSAVLVLLFIGQKGELRVLLTKRSRGLRSFSGHVSFPGGKSDSSDETFVNTCRREAEEEIGLPQDDKILNEKFSLSIEKLNVDLPCYLSTTFLSVKPIVYFLYNSKHSNDGASKYSSPIDGDNFTAILNPGETSSIFSIPLSDLVYHLFYDTPITESKSYKPEYEKRTKITRKWGGLSWNISHYYYPTINHSDEPWLNKIIDMSSDDETLNSNVSDVTYKDVWGLTAKILYDLSRIAHGYVKNINTDGHILRPNIKIGDEDIIYGLSEFGEQMKEKKRSEWESNMLTGSKKVKYSDVIPEFYIKNLDPPSEYESDNEN